MQSDAALATYVRDTCSMVWHPVGTCKMGSDPMAVVEAKLRVRGVEGLRVVDALVMLTITTGNTNAPTIMIGEKAADLVKAERTSRSVLNQPNVQNLMHSSIQVSQIFLFNNFNNLEGFISCHNHSGF